jgi:membrane protease YdiL (CAAX protease family)
MGAHEERKPAWGAWASIGLGVVVLVVMNVVQGIVFLSFVAFKTLGQADGDLQTLSPQQVEDVAKGLENNGDFFAQATWVSALLCIGLIVLLVNVRRGPPLDEYLALRPVSATTLLRALTLAFAVVLFWDGLSILLDRSIVPDVLLEIYGSAHSVWLLWGAVVIAAPVFEEIFFRGFLLEGLRRSRLGSGGAVVLTALSWAALHVQYGLYEISLIFSLGLALGWVRLRTRSLYPTLAMHSLVNLVGILQMAGYWFY